jgi:hypothetical protein
MSQESAPPIDPMAFWKTFYEANIEVWSQSMAYLVESAPFSQAMSSFLDTYLTSSASLQKIVDYYMGMWLANVNMPSREDLSRLERQLINAEPGDLSNLSGLSGKVDQMAQQIATLEATIQRLERQIAHMQQTIEASPQTPHHSNPPQPEHPPRD